MAATARGRAPVPGLDSDQLAEMCARSLRTVGPQTTGELLRRLVEAGAFASIKWHGGRVKNLERALSSAHARELGIRREEGRFEQLASDGRRQRGRPASYRWRAD